MTPFATTTVSRESDSLTSQVRPYFVARIGGLPFRYVEPLRASETMKVIADIVSLDKALSAARDSLSAQLFDAVGSSSDRTTRNALLRLRRDTFNLRAVPIDTSRNLVNGDLLLELSIFRDRLSTRALLLRQLEQCFYQERLRARTWLQQAVSDEDFQSGLLLSSTSLFANLRRYCSTPASKFGSREDQIERGLLRYFARAATKATPFATFCAVICGSLGPSREKGRVTLHGKPRTKRGFVRLNKSLCALLWNHLKTRSGIRQATSIELNPTVEETQGCLRFLTAINGREVFQRLAMNETLMALLPILRQHTGTRMSEIVERVSSDPLIESTPAEVTAYLNQLLNLGLLRFRSEVSEQDVDWDLSLSRMLCRADDPHGKEAVALLSRLRTLTMRFRDARAVERQAILDEANAAITETFNALGITQHLRSQLPIYEDATADASIHIGADDAMADAFGRLGELLSLLLPIAAPRAEQATMRHFFDTYYGTGTTSIPLLHFYEDYFREHFKAHTEKERISAAKGPQAIGDYDLRNPFRLELISSMMDASTKLREIIASIWAAQPTAREIVLRRDELSLAFRQVNAPGERQRSAGIFCQVFSSSDPAVTARVMFPRAQFFAGNGKYFSRFLYMLSPHLSSQVYADNNADANLRQAEICGDADFNANLHAPLLRWEISYPTSEGTLRNNQLRSADLEVQADPLDRFALQLRHRPSGTVVVPADLGFLSPLQRPPLYRLLAQFSPMQGVAIPLPDVPRPAEQTTASGPAQLGVRYRPRISYEGTIVIARRQWSVPSDLFPRKQADEDDVAYFLRVQLWRCQHGIPEQVYVRIHPGSRGLRATKPPAVSPTDASPNAVETLPPDLPIANESLEALEAPVTADDAKGTSEHSKAPRIRQASGSQASRGAQVLQVDSNLAPALDGHHAKKGSPQRRSRDWRKPQFIDFASPLWVRLFDRIPASLTQYTAVLEERFPDSDGLPTGDGEAYAAEMILQVDLAPLDRERAPTSEQMETPLV